jgi:mono/diheme cytochrome c family protein
MTKAWSVQRPRGVRLLTRRGALHWATTALAVMGVAAGCAIVDGGDEAEVARGQELYEANCMDCHGGATGGDVADVPPPHNARGHTWHHPDCLLVEIILDGMPQRPGHPEMPAFGDQFDEADARAILAYIKTWWEPDQRAFQDDITDQVC